ncbi:MAG: MFS transporter [Candidatus Zixiibacteriota bacterium]
MNHQLTGLPFVRRTSTAILDYWGHLKLFSPNARLFLVGIFFVGLNSAVFSLLLNLYFKELGFGEDLIGEILSLTAWGTAVISVPAALMIPKVQVKKILIVSVLLAAIFCFLQASLVRRTPLLAAGFFLGMAGSVTRVAAAPFLMQNSTPKERTYLFSLHFGVYLVAAIVGSLGGGYLPNLFSGLAGSTILAFRYSLYFSVFLSLVALVPFLLITPERTAKGHPERARRRNQKLWTERGRLLFKLCFPFFVLGMGAGLIIPFLNLYFLERFGLPAGTIGVYFAVLQLCMLAGILVGPLLSKKIGMIKSIVSTQLLSIPFMLVLAFTYRLPLAVFSFLFRGTLMNMSQPIGTNFAMEKVKEEEHAMANAMLMLSWTVSWAVSANLGGRLIKTYSFTPPLLITVGLYVVSSILYYVFFSTNEDRQMGKVVVTLGET